MLSYRNFRPFLVGFFAIAACWFAPAAAKRFFAETFYELEAPISLANSRTQDFAKYWEMRSRTKHELIEAGRDAARLAGTLQFEAQQIDALREENLRLGNLLDLPRRPNSRIVVARVARRNLGLWWQQIIVRRGENDGIRFGCPVLNSGVIVGRIRKVYKDTSVVELISSPTFRISAYLVGDEKYPVTFHGNGGGPFNRPSGTIRDIQSDFPDMLVHALPVITTGIGGVFPGGFRIGTLGNGKINLSEDGLFYEAAVELRNLSEIEEVAILVPVNADLTEFDSSEYDVSESDFLK